jgi:ubiquinone/menaquinone biosynthesis C-methylase UbiE
MLRVPERVRDEHVRAQYEHDSAAQGYAASYTDGSPVARYFQSRLYAVMEALRRSPGGDLLDMGCGPGLLARRLAQARSGDFHVCGLDLSPAMIRAAREQVRGFDEVSLAVGRAEQLPLPDHSMDVVVALGVLEYCDLRKALDEVARVTRAGGVVVITMLNPLSPYRLFEWGIWWPFTRLVGRLEKLFGDPLGRRHGAARSGIRTVPSRRLRRHLRERGLVVDDVVYYDLNLLVPPVDVIVRRWTRRWQTDPERTLGRGARGMLGTAYLVVAHRDGSPPGGTRR